MKRAAHSSLAELDRRMQILGERTDVVSLRFIRATGRFVVVFEEERNNTKEWTLTHEEAGMLFGRHLPKFVKSGLWETMSVAVACRHRLHKSIQDELSHKVVGETDWNISRLWLSTGSDKEEEGSHYATQTGLEGKWKVDLYTFRSSGSTCAESCVESDKDTPQEEEMFWLGPEGKVAKIFEIDAFCSEFPGRRLVLDGVMGRGPSREAQKYMDPRSDVLHRDNGNQCLRTSMLNALRLF